MGWQSSHLVGFLDVLFTRKNHNFQANISEGAGPTWAGLVIQTKNKRLFNKAKSKCQKDFSSLKLLSFRKKIKIIIITKYALWLKNLLETIKTDKRFDYQAAAFNK